jgi:hypothetical protein
MADKKISLLNSANALSGFEVLPIVQSGITKKVSILDLTDNKKVFQYVSQNLNSNPANISTRINALPNFTISQDQILGFKDFVYSGANLQRIDVYELKNIGKGNYGVGGTPITESNFEFITSQAINFNTVSTNPSNQVITISTLSGATISSFINAKTPPYVLQSSGDGLRIFDVTDGNVFIFNGVAGTYGSGNLQTVIGDFTVVPRENNVVLSVNGQTGAVVIPETVTEWEDVSGEIQNKLGKSVVVKNTSADDNDYIFFIKKTNGDTSLKIGASGTLESINSLRAGRFDTDGGFGSLNGQVQLLIDALNAGFTSNKRINYQSDLSATFTDRSLVDKGYADTKVPLSGTTSANPITGNLFVNGNVGIGTTIVIANRKLNVNGDASINGLRIGRGSGDLSTNVVLGVNTLNSNTTGTANIAIGETAVFLNTTGFDNIGIGSAAVRNNISGIRNIGIGSGSLLATTASGNTGIGRNTIASNTTGSNNIAIGNSAGNVIGSGSVGATILNNSILIGNDTRPLLDNQTNQIVIGTSAIGLGSNTTVIGNSSSVNAQIFGNLKATGSVQVSDNTAAASALNAGSIRYRATSTNSFMEMSMQTGASVFAWVIIKQNTF